MGFSLLSAPVLCAWSLRSNAVVSSTLCSHQSTSPHVRQDPLGFHNAIILTIITFTAQHSSQMCALYAA